MEDEKERGTRTDELRYSFWERSVMGQSKKFIEEIGFPVQPGEEKIIFPTPKTKKEKEFQEAILTVVHQVITTKEKVMEEINEMKDNKDEDTEVAIACKKVILHSFPKLVGIGSVASAELAKGQEELKNKGLEELSRRKMAEVYQMTKARELEND
jgi:hypothetical protein